MWQASVPHYDTGGFTSHRTHLPDAEYAQALDNMVKACTDLLVRSSDGSRVLLGKRRVQPQPDWWFVGGRMFPGETPASSCARLINRELGLKVGSDRLDVVCTQSLVWGMREQSPQEHGTADLQVPRRRAACAATPLAPCTPIHLTPDPQVVFSLRLTDAEADAVVLDAAEYADSSWVPLADVIGGNYHPALRRAAAALRASDAFCDLRTACGSADSANSDAKIAEMARKFCEAATLAKVNNSGYRVIAPHLNYECDVAVTKR